MGKLVNVHEAKTHFSKLLGRVERGHAVTIARNGVPVAELRPIVRDRPRRHLDELRGRIKVGDDFNSPLPPDLQAAFER